MKPYLRPRWGGIDRLDMYIDGMGQFLSDRGDDDITMDPWSGDKTADETKDVIKAQIDAGWPIPHLVLHHNNPKLQILRLALVLTDGLHRIRRRLHGQKPSPTVPGAGSTSTACGIRGTAKKAASSSTTVVPKNRSI